MKIRILVVILFFIPLFLSYSVSAKPDKGIKRPRITGIAHASFYTKDVENTRWFYKNFLGYAEPFSLMAANGKDLSLTFIKINDRQFVEIFPEKKVGGNRMYHFAVETNDAETMRKYLASKGYKVPDKTPKGRTGNSNYFVTDPNGTICEIVQYEPGSMSEKCKGKEMPDTRISARMSHVGFMVPDLEKAVAFYCGILGFSETWRGSRDGKNVTWVNLKVPDGNDYIELMLYDKAPSESSMGSMNHICLEVKDVAKAESILAARKLPEGCKTPTAMKTGINKKRQINCYDIDGTRVEIMETRTIDRKPVPSSTAPPLKFIH
jgi:catechol 2,3-dioxygenase-like lactoylglutathione lyase family enzyme